MIHSENARLLELARQYRDLDRLSLLRHESCAERYTDYLQTGAGFFGLTTGIISQISEQRYTILAVEPCSAHLSVQDVVPLGKTLCAAAFNENKTMAVNRVGENLVLRRHPAYLALNLEAYIATPIRVNGELFGTLSFSATQARDRDFDASDAELVELMAAHIGRMLEQDYVDSEKRSALASVRESKVLFESAFTYASIGMALVSPEGRWLRVNPAITSIFGYTDAELRAIDFQTITHPDDLDADLEFVQQMLTRERESYRMEKRYFHRDGHEIWALLSVSMVRDEKESPKYFIAQIQDITAQKRAIAELSRRQEELEKLNKKLERLSTTDPLTELGNRRILDDRLKEEISRCLRTGAAVSLLIVDVDRFKHYNDTYGHPAGDVALRELADVLRAVARKSDVVVRQGGEEFALLLPQTDEQGCRDLALRLGRTVAALTVLEAQITVSSGGVTLKPVPDARREPRAGYCDKDRAWCARSIT